MTSLKAKKKVTKTKADTEMIAAQENLLIDKEKRYQTELKKRRRPQVEKLTLLKEPKKQPTKTASKK